MESPEEVDLKFIIQGREFVDSQIQFIQNSLNIAKSEQIEKQLSQTSLAIITSYFIKKLHIKEIEHLFQLRKVNPQDMDKVDIHAKCTSTITELQNEINSQG